MPLAALFVIGLLGTGYASCWLLERVRRWWRGER